MHLAARAGCTESVLELLKLGAVYDIRNDAGAVLADFWFDRANMAKMGAVGARVCIWQCANFQAPN